MCLRVWRQRYAGPCVRRCTATVSLTSWAGGTIVSLRGVIVTINPIRRGGTKSFVDDLGWSRGVVLSRAATLLRSIETQPYDSKICSLSDEHTSLSVVKPILFFFYTFFSSHWGAWIGGLCRRRMYVSSILTSGNKTTTTHNAGAKWADLAWWPRVRRRRQTSLAPQAKWTTRENALLKPQPLGACSRGWMLSHILLLSLAGTTDNPAVSGQPPFCSHGVVRLWG